MGNENKINEVDTTSKFLPAELSDQDARPDTYSLRDEFNKTRKNRSLIVYLFMIIFIGVFTVGAYYFGNYLYDINIKNEISIGEFEDIRLKELIDSAKKNSSGLDIARSDLEKLRMNKQSAMLKVEERFSALSEELYSQELPDEEVELKVIELQKRQVKALASVNRKYDSLITKKKRDIAIIKKDIKSDDVAVKQGIEDSPAVVGNYNKIHDIKIKTIKRSKNIEIRRLKRYYNRYVKSIILKYNPKFRSKRIKSIMNQNNVKYVRNYQFLHEYNKIIAKEGSFSRGYFTGLHKRIKNNSILLNRMMRIPFKNSVRPAIRNINKLTKSIIKDYDKLWSDLVAVINRKNYIIKSYDYAFDYILNEKPESGYIIDPRKSSDIFIHMNKVYKLTDGESAVVFRTDDEYIGMIKIYKKESNGFRAKLVSRMKGKMVKPFDKILLEKNVE